MNNLKILTIALIFLSSLFIITNVSAVCNTPECLCEGADLIIPVNMIVTGEGCYKENLSIATSQISITETADYEVYGIIQRGNPNQTQTNEAFYLIINGKQGPTSLDDTDPAAITLRREFLLYQYLTQGSHTVTMHTAAQCPPDKTANSVDLTHLCLYKTPLPIACSYNSDCNDADEMTIDTCINPATPQSYCQNTPIQPPVIVCTCDSDCNDNNFLTQDSCIFPSTPQSFCQNTPIQTTLNILSPENKTYTSTQIPLTIESNAHHITYSIDNSQEKSYSTQITLSLEEGTHTIKASAFDNENNLLKQESVEFKIKLEKKKKSSGGDKPAQILDCDYHYYNYYLYQELYNEILCPDYEFVKDSFSSQSQITTMQTGNLSIENSITALLNYQTPEENNNNLSIEALLLILFVLLLVILFLIVLNRK